MKFFTKISAVVLFLAFHQSAKASLLVEPYLGYQSGTLKANGSNDQKYTGVDYGARLGYASMIGLAVGVDYFAASFTDDSSPSQTLKVGDLGAFVAFKFPVLFRAYLTYVPSPKIDSSGGGLDYTLQKGNVVKLGVGFTGLPFININLEYQTGSYEEISALGTTATLSDKKTTSAIGLSISAPFNFM